MKPLKPHIFIDAFAECVAGVGMAKRNPRLLSRCRVTAMVNVTDKYGPGHAIATGQMFDRLWHDLQNQGTKQ